MPSPNRRDKGQTINVSPHHAPNRARRAKLVNGWFRYTTFRETLKIVEKHFRPHLGIDETQARISMNAALHALAAL